MSELSDEQVDAELSTAIFCYDPHDKYPEWSNAQMRDAYRAGREDALAERREVVTVRSVEELDALPAEAIIKTEGGSVACRFYDGIHGVVFGDDRPFVWSRLETELPGVILWHPDWGTP